MIINGKNINYLNSQIQLMLDQFSQKLEPPAMNYNTTCKFTAYTCTCTHLTRGGFLNCVPDDLGFLSVDITSLVKQYCNSNNVKELIIHK